MHSVFGSFAGRLRKTSKNFIDNQTFRLHYRVTFTILIVASLLTTLNQYFGAPILCMASGVPGGKTEDESTYLRYSCIISPAHLIKSLLLRIIDDFLLTSQPFMRVRGLIISSLKYTFFFLWQIIGPIVRNESMGLSDL